MVKDLFDDDELSRLEDLLETSDVFAEEEPKPEPENKAKQKADGEPDEDQEEGDPPSGEGDYSNYLYNKLETGDNAHEAVRDVVFDAVKSIYEDGTKYDKSQTGKDFSTLVQTKRKELYDMLENLDVELAGKSVQEVAAAFSSMLDIQSQLCMQKTEGVISIRTRLYNFFTPKAKKSTIPKALRQEINLIFTPEELHAIRARTADMQEEDPLKDFFTTVLDQAYDVVQYNEMSGYLLLEMTQFFLNKLKFNGYGDTSKYVEFLERFDRAKISLEKALDDLKETEKLLNNHLEERPILVELPKLLRILIQIKIGLIDKKQLPKVLEQIKANMGEYARARSAVAFDFNRLPSFQHGVRLRQSIILNLQKDVLKFTGEAFEKEFASVKAEFERMMEEIEASSGELQPGSPEYDEMMAKKANIQKRLEEQRRKLDIVKSQERLVDVQHNMVGQAIKRYQKEEANQQKIDEQLSQAKVDENKVRKIDKTPKKKPSRMVMARRK